MFRTNTALPLDELVVVEVVVLVEVTMVVVVDVGVVALGAVVVSYGQKSASAGYKPMPAM